MAVNGFLVAIVLGILFLAGMAVIGGHFNVPPVTVPVVTLPGITTFSETTLFTSNQGTTTYQSMVTSTTDIWIGTLSKTYTFTTQVPTTYTVETYTFTTQVPTTYTVDGLIADSVQLNGYVVRVQGYIAQTSFAINGRVTYLYELYSGVPSSQANHLVLNGNDQALSLHVSFSGITGSPLSQIGYELVTVTGTFRVDNTYVSQGGLPTYWVDNPVLV